MLQCGYVINDLGSSREIPSFGGACTIIGPHEKDQGSGGAYFPEPGNLAGRRTIGQSVFEKGQKTRAKAHQKKSLINIRITDKILFPRKGAVL